MKTYILSETTQEMLSIREELMNIGDKILALQEQHDETTTCDTEKETFDFLGKYKDVVAEYSSLISLFITNSINRDNNIL